jgi:hypothetical protein
MIEHSKFWDDENDWEMLAVLAMLLIGIMISCADGDATMK